MLSESTAQRLERVLPRGQADRLGEDGVRQAVAAAGDEGDGGADVPRGLRRPQVGGDAGLYVAAARAAHCASAAVRLGGKAVTGQTCSLGGGGRGVHNVIDLNTTRMGDTPVSATEPVTKEGRWAVVQVKTSEQESFHQRCAGFSLLFASPGVPHQNVQST